MTSQFAIRLAAHHIRNYGIIIYPTETVYGLGCDPAHSGAVARLSALKQRDKHSQFLLIASDINQLENYIAKPNTEELSLINTTSEATSWITKAHRHLPSWLTSSEGTIGFRITHHPVTKSLCEQLDHPIISTSANIKGGTPVSNTLQCHQLFEGYIDYILTSDIQRNETPSAIKNLSDGKRLR